MIPFPIVLMAAKVFKFGWWMGQYHGQSPKRHHGFSNNRYSSCLDLGVYKRAEQAKKTLQTVRRYISKNGKKGHCGTKNLKSTQPGPYIYDVFLLDESMEPNYVVNNFKVFSCCP